MTSKADFGAEEWAALIRMPWLAGILVIISDPSARVINEVRAMGHAVDESEHDGAASGLIEELAADMDGWEPELTHAPTAQATTEMLDELGTTFGLVVERCSADEADHIRRWVLAVANETAEAEREGGFLGIGGARVSEAERIVLDQIEDRLAKSA